MLQELFPCSYTGFPLIELESIDNCITKQKIYKIHENYIYI